MMISTIVLKGSYTVDVQGVASDIANEVVQNLDPESHGYIAFSNATDGRDVYLFTGSVAAVVAHASWWIAAFPTASEQRQ